MRQILNAWLDKVETELEPETFADYAADVRNIWIPKYGDRMADQMTVAVIRDWIALEVAATVLHLRHAVALEAAGRGIGAGGL